MDDGTLIRPAGAGDGALLDALAELIAADDVWRLLRRGAASVRRLLGDPEREVTLALAGGAPAGCTVVCMRGAFVGYIQTVFVAPGWRGRGLGRALVARAEERILRESPNVFLCVSESNAGARRLYERLGYRAVGTLDDYVVAGRAEVLMRKTAGPLADFRPAGE